LPGSRARKVIDRIDGTSEIVANKLDSLEVKAGDLLHFITWGGGGWGDPLERDPALVALEVRQGLVSVEGARRYGVVIGDAAATAALRSAMRAGRSEEPELFARGGTIEELRARCLEDTGLPAPLQPIWAEKVAAE
jgi:N-methylhydantoinase B